jgi:hypothetical protein
MPLPIINKMAAVKSISIYSCSNRRKRGEERDNKGA